MRMRTENMTSKMDEPPTSARLWALRLYPPAWRARYGDEFAALLEQQRVTPLVAFDLLLGALDAHLHTDLLPKEVLSMASRLRSTAVTIFAAFAVFVVGYLSYQRLTDPRPPFDAVAQTHLDVRIAFAVLEDAAVLAVLAVLAGGIPILCAALRGAFAAGRRDILLLFGLPVLGIILTAGTLPLVALVFAGATPQTPTFTPFQIAVELGWLALAGVTFIGGTIAVMAAVNRSEIGPRVLRFALIPETIAVAAMMVSLLATVTWATLIWLHTPAMYGGMLGGCATPYCSDSTGDLGLGGVAFVVALMALAVVISAIALRRGYAARASSPA